MMMACGMTGKASQIQSLDFLVEGNSKMTVNDHQIRQLLELLNMRQSQKKDLHLSETLKDKATGLLDNMRESADRNMDLVSESEARDIVILQKVAVKDRGLVARFMIERDKFSAFASYENPEEQINKLIKFASSGHKLIKVRND